MTSKHKALRVLLAIFVLFGLQACSGAPSSSLSTGDNGGVAQSLYPDPYFTQLNGEELPQYDAFIPMLIPSVYTLDFDRVLFAISEVGETEDVYIRFVGMNSTFSFSFSPSGKILDLRFSLWRPMHPYKEEQIENNYEVRSSPIRSSSDMYAGEGDEMIGLLASNSRQDLYIIPQMDSEYETSKFMSFAAFSKWYASLDITGICKTYAPEAPVLYSFSTDSVAVSDLATDGLSVTYLDCSDSTISAMQEADLAAAPIGDFFFLQDYNFFVIRSYCSFDDPSIGIEEKTVGNTTNARKKYKTNGLIFLCIRK
ncbi:MAG: hypothetical protein LBS98_06365 [Coriobacteriales bacterium]|jgi:hypothetical protein|nr:hypothetical protein [Coriobacteriales bacterium]